MALRNTVPFVIMKTDNDAGNRMVAADLSAFLWPGSCVKVRFCRSCGEKGASPVAGRLTPPFYGPEPVTVVKQTPSCKHRSLHRPARSPFFTKSLQNRTFPLRSLV